MRRTETLFEMRTVGSVAVERQVVAEAISGLPSQGPQEERAEEGMKRKLYTAQTLTGATKEVRRLQKRLRQMTDQWETCYRDRIELAKLAADGAAFYSPRKVAEAKATRNYILATYCKMKPDGSPIKPFP